MIPNEYRYLLELLRCAVSGSAPPLLPQDISPDAVFRIAQRNDVFLLAFESAMHLDAVRDHPSFSAWQECYLRRITRTVNQTYELEHLDRLLSEERIEHIFLKGSCLRQMYPRPELREMCDIDILIPTEREADALAAVKRDGYELQEGLTTSHNTELFKRPFQVLELHTYLVPKETRYFPYYASIWERAQKPHKSYTDALSLEDQYIFLLVHLQKHYDYGGTGIRSILDIAVFEAAVGDKLDRAYIHDELAKLELTDFANDVTVLAAHWFGRHTDELTPSQSKTANRILFSTTYGTMEQKQSNLLKHKMDGGKSERRVKIGLFLRQVFPNREFMRGWFAWIDRYPCLLPAAWIARWCCLLVKKPRSLLEHYRWVRGLHLMQDERDEMNGKK